MQMCSRCHKRMAVLFITKIENNETKNEGYCLKCAKELGIPQVDSILSGMGITAEDFDAMEKDLQSLMGGDGDFDDDSDPDDTEEEDDSGDSRTPMMDFRSFFNKITGGENGFTSGGKKEEEAPGEGEISGRTSRGLDKKEEKRKKKESKSRKYLGMYCRDLTAAAREGKLDAVIGRERETARLMQILSRRQKNNPCLIGEPGVGKTAIAEALAQKIVAGDVPYKLRGKEVHLVDLTALVAGTQFRGQFESRMKGLVDEVKALGNIILVIDEVHSIVGVGDSEGSMNAANILKPSLSRGEIQVIGATTLNEYRKYIEKDSALERRFQPIVVDEPSVEETKKILGGIKKYYETYHKIHISDEIISRAVELSERYITDRFLPDKAIDLLDEAAAYVAIHSPVLDRVYYVEDELKRLEKEAENFAEEAPAQATDEERNKHYETLASIKASRMKNEQEYEALKEQMQTINLGEEDLARVIEIWTGIPSGSITANEFERLLGLESRLKKRIVGQDTAVSAVCRAIKRSRAGISYKKKPASFIFAGPTGVGKTELVKVLAEDLFDTPDSLIRLDMSEFMEKHSVSRMIGSPPGYVGYDDAGQLTEKIRRHPYSVVLFDEIEKAHPDVLNVLLQILDDGKVTDSHGKEVKFDNCVIVMTTNAGSTGVSNTAGFGNSSASIAENRTEKALLEFLRPEFINRVDEIITFRSLELSDFERIAAIMLGDLASVLSERGIALRYSEAVPAFVAKNSFSAKYGARNMRRYISREIEDVAAEKIISGYKHVITEVMIDVADGAFVIEVK